jgi:ribosomal protein S18 acetylase RimI-like enzyme
MCWSGSWNASTEKSWRRSGDCHVNASRPASTRPRQGAAADHDAAQPTSVAELESIERDRIAWPALLGATVEEQPDLSLTLVLHDRIGSSLNFAGAIRWPEHEVDERLAQVSARMRAANAWPSVVVCAGLTQPEDLAARLRVAGWIEVFSEQIMATRRPQVVPHLDPNLRVEAVTPQTALESVRLETAVFGLLPDAIGESAELLARSVADGTTRGYIVRLGREPVATARLVPGPTVAGLHAISVAARHRRRGYGRLVTSVATRAGLATGHRQVWLGVLEENTPAVELYRSLGFEPAFTWTRWVAPA